MHGLLKRTFSMFNFLPNSCSKFFFCLHRQGIIDFVQREERPQVAPDELLNVCVWLVLKCSPEMSVNFNRTSLTAVSSANVPPMLAEGQLLPKIFILQALRNFSLNAFSQVRCRHGTKEGTKKLSSVKPTFTQDRTGNIQLCAFMLWWSQHCKSQRQGQPKG